MKVLILSRDYPVNGSIAGMTGGVALWYQKLARGLVESGHEVHVICQAVQKSATFQDEKGVFVHSVAETPRSSRFLSHLAARLKYDLIAFLTAKHLMNIYNFDIVDTPEWAGEGLLVSLRKRPPLIVQAHGNIYKQIEAKNYRNFVWMIAMRIVGLISDFVLKRADIIIATSEEVKKDLTGRLHVPEKRIITIFPFRVDMNKFNGEVSNEDRPLGLSKEDRIVLFVGRLNASKGVKFLCEAAPKILQRLPGTKFVIVGRDTNEAPGGESFKSYLQRVVMSKDSLSQTIFVDYVSEDDLARLYSISSVFVLPSLAESFPMALFEALACGCPSVATPVGVVPTLNLVYPNGIVVPANETDSLASAVIELLSLDSNQRARVRIENRRLIESRFSFPAQVRLVEKTYLLAIMNNSRYNKIYDSVDS
jgi:glycosyltransferase involved in cell wall biosynthesis